MRVILGKAGKSKVLETLMKKMNADRTLLIDSVGVVALRQHSKFYTEIKSFAEIVSMFGDLENKYEFFNAIDDVVLEINCSIEESDILLKWEQRLNKRFTVTVQDNSAGRNLVFDMTLPDE